MKLALSGLTVLALLTVGCNNPLGPASSYVFGTAYTGPVVPGTGTAPSMNECPTATTGTASIALIYDDSSGNVATSCAVSAQSSSLQGTPICTCAGGACKVTGLTLTSSFLASMTAGTNGTVANAITYTVTVNGIMSNSGSLGLTVLGGTWNPNCLGTSLELWLDASDSTTLFQDVAGTVPATNGNSVGFWKDKSSYGYNATQATAGQRPVVNGTSLTFGGNASSTNLMSTMNLSNLTSTNQASMFAVLTPAAGNVAYSGIMTFRVTSGNLTGLIVDGSGTQLGMDWFTNGVYGWSPGDTFTNGTRVVSGFVNNGSTQNLTYNGLVYTNTTLTTAIPANQNIPLYVGQDSSGSRFYSGSMFELTVVGSALSVSSRQKLEGYLAWKWGTHASLTAGHPYLSAAP